MYSILLTLHSLLRWLVLLSLIYTIYRSYNGWRKNSEFTSVDNTLRHATATIAHLQLILGLSLYFLSPLVDYFLNHFKDAIHQREIRFFGMEHSLMMLIGIIVITIGSALSKRKNSDQEKFKAIAIWFSTGLFIILTSIPWSFSPLVSRPYFRFF